MMSEILTGIGVLLIASIFYKVKIRKLRSRLENVKNDIDDALKDNSFNEGYIVHSMTYGENPKLPFDVIIYVSELFRYKNGKSKIELNDIEIVWKHDTSMPNYDNVLEFVKRHYFVSLMDTSKIEWLEKTEDVKEIRRKKIEHLKELIDKENKK